MSSDVTGKSEEDRQLSDYYLGFKYQTDEKFEANRKSLDNPVDRYREILDVRLIRNHAVGSKLLDFPIGTGRDCTSRTLSIAGYAVGCGRVMLEIAAPPAIAFSFFSSVCAPVSSPSPSSSSFIDTRT